MSKRWAAFEESLLAQYYRTKTTKELMSLLVGKSRDSINAKIRRMKKKNKVGSRRNKSTIKRAYLQRKRRWK